MLFRKLTINADADGRFECRADDGGGDQLLLRNAETPVVLVAMLDAVGWLLVVARTRSAVVAKVVREPMNGLVGGEFAVNAIV